MAHEVPPSATAGKAADLRKANGQSCRSAHKKLKGAENQKRQPASLSLFAYIVRALAKVGRLALAQSETRREKHFLRKSAEPSCLFRNDML